MPFAIFVSTKLCNCNRRLYRVDKALTFVQPFCLFATGVHVMMWGQIDLVSNTVDMTLGIPAEALAAAGVRDLPADYVLPVPVKGTTQAPVVNWSK